MLSDVSIMQAMDEGDIILLHDGRPGARDSCLQPASIDVHLGGRLIWFTEAVEEIDPAKHQPELTEYKKIQEQGFALMPGEFVLGTTAETLGLGEGYAAEVTGKSSLARLGLVVHATAGFIDPGFSGKVTLEIKNFNHKPIRLRAGMKIAQFKFFRLTEPCARPYGTPALGSHYQGQSDVTASRSWT